MAAGQPPLPVPRESHSHVPAGLGLCGSAAAHPWAGQCGSPALPPPRHPDRPRREPQPSPSAPRGHGLPLPTLSQLPADRTALGTPRTAGLESLGLPARPNPCGDAHGSLSRCVNTERFVCRQNLQPCQLLRSPGDAPSLREGSRAVLPFGMPRNPGGRRLLPFGRAERGEAAVGARRGAEPRLRSPCQDVLATFPNTDTPAAKSELAGGLALPSLSGPRLPLR